MKPLEDVRIIAVEQYGAGPFGSVHLADLGAEVIKIEDPRVGGDVGRYVPPYAEGEDSLFFETFNRNKRSLSLDLATPAGPRGLRGPGRRSATPSTPTCAATCRRRSDPLRRPQAPQPGDRLLLADRLRDDRAARSKEPGYDYVLQGLAGWMDADRRARRPADQVRACRWSTTPAASSPRSRCSPACTPPAATASAWTATSASTTPRSAMLTYPATWHLNAGFTPVRTRHSAHPSLVPFQAFEAKDGWLVVGCAKEKFWQRLAVVIERPGVGRPTRGSRTFADRDSATATSCCRCSRRSSRQRTVAEWLEPLLRRPSIPCGADQRRRRGADRAAHRSPATWSSRPSTRATARSARSPRRCGSAPSRPTYRRAPLRNEDADQVARASCSGYDAAAVADLTRPGRLRRDASRPTPTTRAALARLRPAPRGDAARRRCARGRRARHLLDGLGHRGRRGRAPAPPRPALAVARRARRPARGDAARHAATRVGAPAAALADGTLVHALDFDDTHAGGLVHATAVVLPAALAVGEQVGAAGARSLVAAVVGYETVCRVAGAAPHALPRPRPARHARSCGVFAVGAGRRPADAASTPRTTVDALGIAGSQAGGLLEFLPPAPSTKQLHPGLAVARRHPRRPARRRRRRPARTPSSTARTACTPRSPTARVDLDARWPPTSGTRWETTRIGIKPYPACQLMHAALDAGRAGAAPLDPARRVAGDRGRGAPRQRRRSSATPRQGRPAHGVRREVLAAVERGRAARSTARSPSTPTSRLARPARGSAPSPPGSA